MDIVNYRVVRGWGGSVRALEHMALDSDEEALDWLARRWGNDEAARVQRMDDDGHWRGVRKPLPSALRNLRGQGEFEDDTGGSI